jgi:hypothetical protein
VKTLLKFLAAVLVVLVVAMVGIYIWASMTSSRILSQTYETHSVDFPIPFPLDSQEVAALGLTDEAARQFAQERAVERGKHLVNARYACTACHEASFGGGVMIDAFPIGRLLAPNVTLGDGSRAGLHAADWDRTEARRASRRPPGRMPPKTSAHVRQSSRTSSRYPDAAGRQHGSRAFLRSAGKFLLASGQMNRRRQ